MEKKNHWILARLEQVFQSSYTVPQSLNSIHWQQYEMRTFASAGHQVNSIQRYVHLLSNTNYPFGRHSEATMQNKMETGSWMADMGSNLVVSNLVNFVISIWFRYFFISSIFFVTSHSITSRRFEQKRRYRTGKRIARLRRIAFQHCAHYGISASAGKSISYTLWCLFLITCVSF